MILQLESNAVPCASGHLFCQSHTEYLGVSLKLLLEHLTFSAYLIVQGKNEHLFTLKPQVHAADEVHLRRDDAGTCHHGHRERELENNEPLPHESGSGHSAARRRMENRNRTKR